MRCCGRLWPARSAPPVCTPRLGIHHHNRYDSFCLADDLMEPFRPTVDHAVVEYMSDHDEPYGLEAAAKQQIIGELTGRYLMGGELADAV